MSFVETPQKEALERKRNKDNDDDYLSSCGGRTDQICDCDWTPALDGGLVFFVLAGRAQLQSGELRSLGPTDAQHRLSAKLPQILARRRRF